MSEQVNTQDVNQNKAKINWVQLSLWSAIYGLGCIILAILIVFLGLIPFLEMLIVNTFISFLIIVLIIGWVTLILISFVSGIVAFIKILFNKGLLRGIGKIIIGLSISLSSITFVLFFIIWSSRIFNRMECGMNISVLDKSLQLYASDFQKYPEPDKWCDLVIKYEDVSQRSFVCGGGDKGSSHYAINPDCEPNSPNDIVLIFETKGGWNQYGGTELLTFDNHKGKGANIGFNDGHVEFIKPEDVNKLKWKAEVNE